MSLAGACQCGAVTVEARGDPLTTRECWCRDCQKLAAGGPTRNIFFHSADVTIAGPVKAHDVMPDSGNPLERGFCGECGTPVYSQSHVRRHLITLRIGLFDDTSALGPQSAIWTASAPAWAKLDPALPQVERQPPPLA